MAQNPVCSEIGIYISTRGYALWVGLWQALTVAYVAVKVQAVLNLTELPSGIIECKKHVQSPIRMSPAQASRLSPVSR